MSKKRKRYGNKISQKQLQNLILRYLKRKKQKSYSLGVIQSKLKTKNSKDAIKSALSALLKEGRIISDRSNKYRIHPDQVDDLKRIPAIQLEGTIDLTLSGGGYVIVEGQERDIYVPKRHVNGALQGDRVLIEARIFKNGRRSEGRVLSIIKRKRSNFIGTFQNFKKYGYVFVESPKFDLDIRVLPDDFNKAESGDFVIVEVFDFGKNKRQEILGKIIKVLAYEDQDEFEMNSILINNGFTLDFPEGVISEANKLPKIIAQDEIDIRRDIRDVLTFTIDPKDAKDFDDAISFQELENGHIEVGVHIADVTHYLKPGTELDKEGAKRSTSVYLVDRVCPMLPEVISNELCSLRPNEDKLTFSAIFEFDKNCKIKNTWFGKTVIHSDKRYTYEEAQELIESQEGENSAVLMALNRIAKDLHAKRFKNGSINFDGDEVVIELDEKGLPTKISRKVRKDAHKLIEELMLLANKHVARFIAKKGKPTEIPFAYRVHDLPDAERLMELALLASEFGIRLNFDSPGHIRTSLNSLADLDDGDDIISILRPMAIRSMSKAIYTTDNIGHYGLGFEHYCHFTSPIRRYADVICHRILFENLEATKRMDKSEIEDRCHYISLKERDAISAERESIKYKQVEYYNGRIGETEDGVIRSIIDRGFFVELVDSLADGYVSFETFGEEVMIHPAKIKVTGLSSGKIWQIGDRIEVEIINADITKRQIDLRLSISEDKAYT